LVDIYDIVVIGAGIAGSISANLLAQKGYKVIILERMQLPGYHLSENILKVNHPIFEKLDVEDEIKQVIKNEYSIGYAFNNSNMAFKLTFEQTNEDSKVLSWVNRIAFDSILRNKAVEKGAILVKECNVTSVNLDKENQVKVSTQTFNGEKDFYARYVIDASGKSSILANMLGIKEFGEPLDERTAVFAHFEDVDFSWFGDAVPNSEVIIFENGYFSFIPITNSRASIGVILSNEIAKKYENNFEKLYEEQILNSSLLARRLSHAKRVTPCFPVLNREYKCKTFNGKNYFLVGDAGAFLDPVFSAGIHIAIESSIHVSEKIDALIKNIETYENIEKEYNEFMNNLLGTYKKFTYEFLEDSLYKKMLTATADPHLPNILSLLLATGMSENNRGMSLEDTIITNRKAFNS